MNFGLLLPRSADNTFQGRKIVIWVYGLVTAVVVVRSLIHVFLPDGGAQVIATIPLDQWSPDAAQTIIAMFAYWGWIQVQVGLIQVIVLIRYRSLIPLMYCAMIIGVLGRIGVDLSKPIVATGTTPGVVGNLPALAIFVLMLFLALSSSKKAT